MSTERDTVVQITVSTAVVALFALTIIVIGMQYYTTGNESQGAIALVVSIAGFVVAMSLVGYFIVGG